ncbi:MAG TPA: slipin family protein [Solirubrobacterales bacterium]|nr:slipin family protein [Solirubrobacterales bacterium]
MVPATLIRERRAARRRRRSEEAQHEAGQASAREQAPEQARLDARKFVNPVSATAAAVVWAVGTVGGAFLSAISPAIGLPVIFGSLIVGFYLMFAVKIANQWERAVVLRLGRYRGLRGPGLFWIVPIFDSVAHFVDQRVRTTDVSAESALTRDTVPVDVDAIVFWLVWDAEKSILEVMSFERAIFLSAQTALREAIGRHDLAEMITEREKLGHQLQQILDEKTNPWGITVQSVEIRDVRIPADLEDAMSRQAQAERERQARIILGTAETEIAGKFAAAAVVYQGNPVAMHLRAMNMLYEAIKEKGSMVIVPSSAVETMGLGAITGLASLGGARIAGFPAPAEAPAPPAEGAPPSGA